VGLVSRSRIVPISPEQDTAGPMTRTVADAAALLTVIAGTDPADPATRDADARKSNYLAALNRSALKGARIGVWAANKGRSAEADAIFEDALKVLRAQGAVLVEVKAPDAAALGKIGALEGDCLRTEFKAAINAYLATTPVAVKTRTLDDLIAFDKAEPREMPLFGQEIFEDAAKRPPITDPGYLAKRNEARAQSRQVLDTMLSEGQLDAIVVTGNGPAGIVDPVNGTRMFGAASNLPAVSGYPHLVVPAGYATGLPMAISFYGPAWSEAKLLGYGYAYEQATRLRREPEFLPNVAARPEIARAYDPS
jgi:amidase